MMQVFSRLFGSAEEPLSPEERQQRLLLAEVDRLAREEAKYLKAPALDMGGSPKEADDALQLAADRVKKLVALKFLGNKNAVQGFFRRCVEDEMLTTLFKKQEAGADWQVVGYVRKHWPKELFDLFGRLPHEEVFLMGLKRMRRRVLGRRWKRYPNEHRFERQKFLMSGRHVLEHLVDETLLAAVKLAGKCGQRALGRIWENWLGPESDLARFVKKEKRNGMDADDVCMETWHKINRQITVNNGIILEDQGTLRGYIFRAGKNFWVNQLKQEEKGLDFKKEWGKQQVQAEKDRLNRLGEDDPLLEAPRSEVTECASRLQNEQRKAIFFWHLEGYSDTEIVEKLEGRLAKQTVKNEKGRARDFVEECLCVKTLTRPLQEIYRLHKEGMEDRAIAQKLGKEEEAVRQLKVEAEEDVQRCTCTQKLREELRIPYKLHSGGMEIAAIAQEMKRDEQTIQAHLDEAEESVQICICTQKLPEQLKTVYRLHRKEKMESADIAQKMKRDEQTVQALLDEAEESVQICTCTQKLPEQLKTVYKLHRKGMEIADIVQKTKRDEQTVLTHLDKAETLLNACIEALNKPKP